MLHDLLKLSPRPIIHRTDTLTSTSSNCIYIGMGHFSYYPYTVLHFLELLIYVSTACNITSYVCTYMRTKKWTVKNLEHMCMYHFAGM